MKDNTFLKSIAVSGDSNSDKKQGEAGKKGDSSSSGGASAIGAETLSAIKGALDLNVTGDLPVFGNIASGLMAPRQMGPVIPKPDTTGTTPKTVQVTVQFK
jgi:hypothetical protein